MKENSKDEDQIEKPIFGPETEDISAINQDKSAADVQLHAPDLAAASVSNNSRTNGFLAKVLDILNWMPQRCRYDPENPPSFTLSMNILLAFVCSS